MKRLLFSLAATGAVCIINQAYFIMIGTIIIFSVLNTVSDVSKFLSHEPDKLAEHSR